MRLDIIATGLVYLKPAQQREIILPTSICRAEPVGRLFLNVPMMAANTNLECGRMNGRIINFPALFPGTQEHPVVVEEVAVVEVEISLLL